MIKINIIIPTYKRPDDLLVTIDSFIRELSGTDYWIYIIDNDPASRLKDVETPRVTIEKGKINGPCQARNQAIDYMRPGADYIWYADDDIFVHNIAPIKTILNRNDLDVISFGTMGQNDRKFQRNMIKRIMSSILPDFKTQLSGGNCIVKQKTTSIKWCDLYTCYSNSEDVEYAFRLQKKGFKLGYARHIKITHFGDNRPKAHFLPVLRYVSETYITKLHRKRKIIWYFWNYLQLFRSIRSYRFLKISIITCTTKSPDEIMKIYRSIKQ
jgi:glycosyltransferase involved in cell wall biosynthesis